MNKSGGLRRPEPLGADKTALFLDLDGTLAPFAPRPEDVRADPARSRLLHRLRVQLDGRFAVISGRSLSDIDRILDGAAHAAAGVHGLERRRADGVVIRSPPSDALPKARLTLNRIADQWPGSLIEDKGLSVAAHFRGAPAAERPLVEAARALAADGRLTLQPGDMVVELRSPGPDKGAALTAFMAEAPFTGATPIFVGDDLTDEAGFAAARALGGYGVLVGRERPSVAQRRLTDVAAVLDWLGAVTSGSAVA